MRALGTLGADGWCSTSVGSRRSVRAIRSGGRAARPTSRIVVSAGVLVVVGLVLVWPMARRAWETATTGVAPGSWIVLRADSAGAGIVAVGAAPDDDTYEPGAWLQATRDARWTRIGHVEAAGQVLDVASARDRLIAVGSVHGRPAALERADGDASEWKPSWTVIGSGIDGELSAVAASPDGLEVVAVGSERGPGGSRARMVHRVEDRWIPGSDEHPSAAAAVAYLGTDPIAGGSRIVEQSNSRAAVWEWDRVASRWSATELPVPDGSRRSMVVGIAGSSDLAVAVGMIDLSPVAWVREGGAWALAGALPDPDVAGRRVTAIERSGDTTTFLAVGQQTGLGDVQTPLAWSSTDGRTWRRVGVGGAGGTGLVDVFTDRRGALVAVGNRTIRKQSSAVVYELEGAILSPRGGG